MRSMFSIKNDAYPLLRLAIPLALTGLVQSAVWFFETIFLAQLGQEALAAGSLVSWFCATLTVIIFGALSSINILVSHKHGAGDQGGIALVARDGLLLAALMAVPATILLWNMSFVFSLFGQPESVVDLAKPYLHALSWGIIAQFMTLACLEVIIGLGHARVIFAFSVITVSLNIFWSYLLIFGKWGFPALGIAGAGWGITISYAITALFLAIFIVAKRDYRTYFRHSFKFEKPVFLKELMQIGIPVGFMYCVEVAFFFALTLCMGMFGTEILAANQIVLQYDCLFMSMMFAIAQAVTVRMGHLLGAKEVLSAKKVNAVGICIAVILMSVIALFYWFLPVALISIDLDVSNPANTDLIAEIKSLLAIAAVFQIFEASRIVLFGSLRGLKDTKFTLLTSIISFWFIALPIGYLLATYLHFGGAGFWWSMVMGAAFSVILLQWRFNARIKRYVSFNK